VTTHPLSVSVTGKGHVTGGGIDCGNGSTDCSADETAGTTVTLTATHATGAAFKSWGGSCSGTKTTCSVAMSAARTVTATFTGGSTQKATVKVTVTGPGTVRGSGIVCGGGHKTCSASANVGATITLAATPGSKSHFAGWGGGCSGTKDSCTLVVRAALSVSARFASGGGGGTPAPANVLSALARPKVAGSGSLFHVTLQFRTDRAGLAAVTASLAGWPVTGLQLGLGAGAATIGPFPVSRPGFYAFRVTLGGGVLEWHTFLGRCGAAAPKSAGSFVVTGADPTIRRSGGNWRFGVRFTSNRPALAVLRVQQNGTKGFREVVLNASRGANVSRPLVLGPGNYTATLTATDAFGRVRSATWLVLLTR
jgi:hypothetical protein